MFLEMVKRVNHLDGDVKFALQESLQRNCFCCHPESLIQAMLSCEDRELRRTGVRLIEAIREGDQDQVHPDQLGDNSVRAERNNPTIRWNATSLRNLIDWEAATVDSQMLEPPLTTSLTMTEVRAFIHHPMEVPKYPVHTQAVERHIRRLNAASLEVNLLNQSLILPK